MASIRNRLHKVSLGLGKYTDAVEAPPGLIPPDDTPGYIEAAKVCGDMAKSIAAERLQKDNATAKEKLKKEKLTKTVSELRSEEVLE